MLTEVNRTVSQNFERGLMELCILTKLGLEKSWRPHYYLENSKVKVGSDLFNSN